MKFILSSDKLPLYNNTNFGDVKRKFHFSEFFLASRHMTRSKAGPAGVSSDQVDFTNFSWQRGQVMAIFPFPRGTRTTWRHLGHRK